MENNRPKLVSLSSRLREPIALCDTAKVLSGMRMIKRKRMAMMKIMGMMMMRMIRAKRPPGPDTSKVFFNRMKCW